MAKVRIYNTIHGKVIILQKNQIKDKLEAIFGLVGQGESTEYSFKEEDLKGDDNFTCCVFDDDKENTTNSDSESNSSSDYSF
jgi:hypothetical protein